MTTLQFLSNLDVYKDDNLEDTDWRFISKQFEEVPVFGISTMSRQIGQVWLTVVRLTVFVVINLLNRKATLRLMNLPTPVLLHDGAKYDDSFLFTSIDGKIIIAREGRYLDYNQQEGSKVDHIDLFNRDLVAEVIRLQETDYGKEPNWCRGITKFENLFFVTVDGRYGTDLSFGVLVLDKKGILINEHRLTWSEIGPEDDIRYVLGFDLEVF